METLAKQQTIENAEAPTYPWIDTSLYPFQHKFINLSAGKMHYVDEGTGDVLLFVHGTPTWSFLYRDFIEAFRRTHRCIAIDHIGFGLSEQPSKFGGTPQEHAANLLELIRRLNLTNITLIVHDFGGPIGLAAANSIPAKVKRIVLFNTWLWETKSNPEARKINKVLSGWLGKFLYLNLNFSPKVLFKKAFHNKKILTRKLHDHYIKPFPNVSSRLSLLNLGKSLIGASDWYAEQNENLKIIRNKPWLILWGSKDEFITPAALSYWRKLIPHAEVKVLECGHFVQEENTIASIRFLTRFFSKH